MNQNALVGRLFIYTTMGLCATSKKTIFMQRICWQISLLHEGNLIKRRIYCRRDYLLPNSTRTNVVSHTTNAPLPISGKNKEIWKKHTDGLKKLSTVLNA